MGAEAGLCRVENAAVGSGYRHRNGCFFALLKQVEVEVFFDVFLAGDLDEIGVSMPGIERREPCNCLFLLPNDVDYLLQFECNHCAG